MITIALDAMGGDHGPQVTLPATFDFLRKNPSCSAILVGQEVVLRPYITPVEQEFLARIAVRNATEVVDMDEPVASALRGKRGQSLLKNLAQALDEMPEKRLIALATNPMEDGGRLGCCG